MTQTENKREAQELEGLMQACRMIPEQVFAHLWGKFCPLSESYDPGTLAVREGNRQVVFYLMALAGKITFEQVEAIWKSIKAKSKS